MTEIMKKDQESDVSYHSDLSVSLQNNPSSFTYFFTVMWFHAANITLHLQQTIGDSGYVDKSKRYSLDKENYSPNKRVRKSLANNWAMRASGLDDSLTAPETPSKSLVGTSDASMLFSPPAILKETLPDDSGAAGLEGLGR